MRPAEVRRLPNARVRFWRKTFRRSFYRKWVAETVMVVPLNRPFNWAKKSAGYYSFDTGYSRRVPRCIKQIGQSGVED